MKNEFAKLCNKCINGTDTRFTTYDEPIPPVRANQMDIEHIPVVDGQERPYDAQQASLRRISPLHAARMLTRNQLNEGITQLMKNQMTVQTMRKSMEKKR